jgi:hypothetical protein
MITMKENVFVPLLILLCVFFLSCTKTEQQDCTPIDRVNTNLPSHFLYTHENEQIPEQFPILGNFISPDTYNDSIIYKTDGWNFYCKYNSAPAEKVEYFYHSKPCVSGAWYHRDAYVCGDKYYILDGKDAGGVRLYGPFNITS